VADALLKATVKAETEKATARLKGSARAEKYLLHRARSVANRLTLYVSKKITSILGQAMIPKVTMT